MRFFIYTHYQLDLLTFIKAIGPIVVAGVVLLTFLILISSDRSLRACVQPVKTERGKP